MRVVRGAIVLGGLAAFVASAGADGLDAERWAPPAGAAGGLVVERPMVARHLGWGLGAFVSFADDALTLESPTTGDVVARPVDTAWTVDVLASIGLWNRVELGLHLPIHAVYEGDTLPLGGQALDASAGVGDLRLVAKVGLLGGLGRKGFALSGALTTTAPTGNDEALRGSGGASFQPALLAGWLAGRYGIFAHVGVRLRTSMEDVDPIGHELMWGLGGAITLLPDQGKRLELMLEHAGALDVSREDDTDTDVAMELFAGLGFWPTASLGFTLGGALGVSDGLGIPDFRLLAGVRFTPGGAPGIPPYRDGDGDGVPDVRDDCTAQPEDDDGFEDGDGCPARGKVEISRGEVKMLGKILFESESSNLSPKNRPLLDDLAALFASNPQLTKIEIQGHTDNTGDPGFNERLSKARAESVRAALIERKIDGDRLVAKGYGESRPVAPNKSKAGRARNRRVDFVIVGRD